MPNSWLNVPHFRQELEYACVAACARMVLAHYGDVRTEADSTSSILFEQVRDPPDLGRRPVGQARLSAVGFGGFRAGSGLRCHVTPRTSNGLTDPLGVQVMCTPMELRGESIRLACLLL